MIKTNLLLVVLASAFVFASCKKEEGAGDEAAKATETASGETAPTDEPATTAVPAAEQPAEPAEPTEPAEEVAPAAPTAATGDMTRDQIAEKVVEMFTKMNEIVKGADNDCAKIASEFTTVIAEYKPVMAAGKALDADPENKKWFEENYGEKVTGIMTEMMGNMSECMQDPAVMQAFQGMEE